MEYHKVLWRLLSYLTAAILSARTSFNHKRENLISCFIFRYTVVAVALTVVTCSDLLQLIALLFEWLYLASYFFTSLIS